MVAARATPGTPMVSALAASVRIGGTGNGGRDDGKETSPPVTIEEIVLAGAASMARVAASGRWWCWGGGNSGAGGRAGQGQCASTAHVCSNVDCRGSETETATERMRTDTCGGDGNRHEHRGGLGDNSGGSNGDRGQQGHPTYDNNGAGEGMNGKNGSTRSGKNNDSMVCSKCCRNCDSNGGDSV